MVGRLLYSYVGGGFEAFSTVFSHCIALRFVGTVIYLHHEVRGSTALLMYKTMHALVYGVLHRQ